MTISGIELGIGGLIFVTLKNHVTSLFDLISNLVYKQITIDNSVNEELFNKLEGWLGQQKVVFCNTYQLKENEEVEKTFLGVGYGQSLYNINGKFCSVGKERIDKNGSFKVIDSITIKVFFGNLKDVSTILDEVTQFNDSAYEDDVVVISGYTRFLKGKRPLNTIALSQKDKDFLIKDISSFLDSKQSYRSKGISYKRNYLFYGTPGTGKTSLVWALASYFGFKICIVNLETMGSFNDLQRILACNKNTIFLIEDIDAAGVDVHERCLSKSRGNSGGEGSIVYNSNDSDSRLSLSNLLNIFDGINTPESLICFFTTNHIDKLDRAFLRDGRMDIKLELKDIDKRCLIDNMAKNILEQEQCEILEKELRDDIRILPATAQEYLMNLGVGEVVERINR